MFQQNINFFLLSSKYKMIITKTNIVWTIILMFQTIIIIDILSGDLRNKQGLSSRNQYTGWMGFDSAIRYVPCKIKNLIIFYKIKIPFFTDSFSYQLCTDIHVFYKAR